MSESIIREKAKEFAKNIAHYTLQAMSCVFAKQKRQRVAKFATLLQCTKKSLMGTRF